MENNLKVEEVIQPCLTSDKLLDGFSLDGVSVTLDKDEQGCECINIKVAENVQLITPVQLLYAKIFSLFNNDVVGIRFELSANTSLAFVDTLIEGASSKRCLSNSVYQFQMAQNADFKHYRVIKNADKVSAKISYSLDQGAHLKSVLVVFSSQEVSHNIFVDYKGECAEAQLFGLMFGQKQQRIENKTEIIHNVSRCVTHELYKGIYRDESQAKFDGVIMVQAQKSEAIQTTKSLLLSKEAVSDARPQLKIFADDVKCSHGATVGQLDNEALFYLKSRGIPEILAKQLLVEAFASEIVEKIEFEPLRQNISQIIVL